MPTPSKDLWASALEHLTEIDRQQLNFCNGQNKLTILSDLQVLTESAKEQCIKKRWRFSRPGRNGETIVLRDIFTKMVVWIERFKQVGDTVVQYDPGHAALPWAGVRFIVQVAISDIVKFDFVVEGAESIARMLGRYAIFEEIYLRRTSKASMELENALVRLYSTILMYESKAKRFFDQSSSKRILRSAFVIEDEFGSLARKMDLEQSHVDRCAATLGAENQNNISDSLEALSISQYEKHARLMDLLHSIDGPILRMSSQLNDIEDNLDKSKRYEILRWLSAQPYIEHHEQISKKALAGTGKWLLEDPIYAKWHRGSTSSLLWLHGKVGAGKSTLVSIVIEDAMRRSEAGQSPPPVYFYCSRDAAEPQRSDPAAILSSIVRQLSCAEPGLPLLPPVIEKYEKKGQGFSSQGLQFGESCELIMKLIEHYPVTTIVIDALDECNPDKREMLLDAIEGLLQNSSLGLLKVFLSSRDDQDIACTLREYPNLDLVSSRNSADIEAFVREETNRLVKKQRLLRNSHAKQALKTLIIDEVSRAADGMFRWAGLQLELLCTMKLDQDVRARLGRIPPKLEQLYLEIYEKNLLKYPGEVGQSIISNIMKWMLCAQRQMKSSEFCTAIVLNTALTEELTKEHVLDLCHNFVVFDDSLDVFRFAHLSVREFLEKQHEYMALSCHLLAAETCLLQFIGSSDCSAAKAFLRDHYTLELRGKAASTADLLGGFHTYATMFWARHCQLVGEEGRTSNPRFERIFRVFLSDASDDLSPLNIWIQSAQRNILIERDHFLYCLKHDSDYEPGDRVYLVACAYAFCEIIRVCMNANPPENWVAGCSLAIRYRKDEALKTILDNRSGHEIPRHLVSKVAIRLDPDTLEWVLRKSKVDVATVVDEIINEQEYYDVKAVESVLVRHKLAKVSRTTLEFAAGFCSASTFETLLLQSEDNAISWDSLFEQAGGEGNWEVMRLLLDKKHFKITPDIMQAIAEVGDEKVMRLLLDREDAGEITSDVIMASCSNENEKVLGLLLDRSASDRIPEGAMSRAMTNSNKKILSLLLNSGYPISQTLMNQAAAHGYASHLRLLLDHGSLITRSVLRCAAGNYYDGTNVMSLLLAEAKDRMIREEMTDMMKIAAKQVRLDVMRLLLERAGNTLIGEDVLMTATNTCYGNGLIKMLSTRDWELTKEVLEAMMRSLVSGEALQLVLDRLVDLEITGEILVAAAGNPSFGDQLVRRLLDRVNLLDVVIDPLLVEAAGNRNFGLDVILLVKRRVGDINVTQKATERAAQAGSVRTMTFLLDHMSAPITDAVVVEALMRHRLEMVQFLLDRATDLPITRNLLHTAARYSSYGCLNLIWERASRAEMDEDMTRDLAQAAIENRYGADENLRFLLDKVENIVIGPEALISIARRDHKALLDLLVDYGINLQITLEVLQAAAGIMTRHGPLMIEFLLERSDKVELTDEIFKAAAGSGNKRVLEVVSKYCGLAEVSNKLLDLVRLRDAVGPIYYDIESNFHLPMEDTDSSLALVTELLGRGVEPDVPDGDGRTPLFHAAARGNILTVQALLSAGANPNLTDRKGRMPLYYAAGRGHYRIVEILLDLGVPTHLEDEDGQTPALKARGEGHMRVFRLLERRRQPQ